MTELTGKRVASLPKWAQDALNDQRRRIGALTEEVSHLRGQVKPGRIYYKVSMNDPVYIPEEALVFFRIGAMEEVHKGDEIEVDLDLNRKMINVRSFFGGISVLPQAENSLVLFPYSRSNIGRGGAWDGLTAGERKEKAEEE